MDPINLAQFLVHKLSAAMSQNRRSDVPSLARQRGRASGIVDGNFSCWNAGMARGINLITSGRGSASLSR